MADNRGAQALRKRLADEKSQTALAERAGLSQSHISRLAAGGVPKLLEDALALRDAAGIDPDWWHEEALVEAGEPAA